MSRSCQQASRLISESLDRPLTLLQRVSLWFHLKICRHCQTYRQHQERLRRLLRDSDPEAPGLPEATRERLRRQLLDDPDAPD